MESAAFSAHLELPPAAPSTIPTVSVAEAQFARTARSITTSLQIPAVLCVLIFLPIVALALIHLSAYLAKTLSSFRQIPHVFLVPQ